MKGFALALASAMVLFAGCGSGESSSTNPHDSSASASTALSKKTFLAQANAICAAGNKDVEAAVQRTLSADRANAAGAEYFVTARGKETTDADAGKFIASTLLPMTQEQVDAIGALGAPDGSEGQVAEILGKAQDGIDRLKAASSLLTSRGINPFTEFSHQANAFGLTKCADLIAAEAGPGRSTGTGDKLIAAR